MTLDKLEIFVPGRLCLIGEHSDWACNYQSINPSLKDGLAITILLNDGIHAIVKKARDIHINYLNKEKKETHCSLNEIDKIIKENDFWKYIYSAIKYMVINYKCAGLDMFIDEASLPMKKGLGSSAAISLLVVKAYNQLYSLNLSEEMEIEAAYNSEIQIGSKCGKLDQICNIDQQVKLMKFNYSNNFAKVNTSKINVKKDVFMVYVDLNGEKNTIKILDDLNKCYPFSHNNLEKEVQRFLGDINEEMVYQAKEYLENGNIKELGKLLNTYQKLFDNTLGKVSQELKAPILHKLLNDEIIKKITYGGKGCGSGGDGSAQFVAKNEECQKKLLKYLSEDLKLQCKSLTIKGNNTE